MGLPLQPDLRPWPSWARSLLLLAGIALALAAAAAVARSQNVAPQLVLSGSGLELIRALERDFAGAQRRIWVMMYVIRQDGEGPVDALLQALASAAARGVDVRVCLDRDSKDPEKNREAGLWLNAHGVRVVWDEMDRITHAKVVLIDDRRFYIGSHNWTRSALALNREASVIIDDPAQAELVVAWFHRIPDWNSP